MASLDASNYRCVLTGDTFDDIHHLYSFNTILKETLANISLDNRKEISDYSRDELANILNTVKEEHNKHPLGVCLRKDIHKLFHREYGYNNTPEQFYEFRDRWYSGDFC
jgi:hypothetical protein